MAGIGGTVADVLAVMELLDNELETGSGETDETSAITALIQAQHYFETLCAITPRTLQDTVTISTTASTETTTWTSALIRFDAMWLLDANGLPIRQIESIDEVGGHAPGLPWPLDMVTVVGASGSPFAFYGNMRNFYWLNIPADVVTMRIYGFLEKARFIDRTSDFNYPYRCHLAFAQFATHIMQIGADDVSTDLEKLGARIFSPVLTQLKRFNRSGPQARHYSEFHTT